LEEEFFNFCEMLQLAEVIIGAESTLPAGEITRALGSMADHIAAIVQAVIDRVAVGHRLNLRFSMRAGQVAEGFAMRKEWRRSGA
jgi:hypothetical protein